MNFIKQHLKFFLFFIIVVISSIVLLYQFYMSLMSNLDYQKLDKQIVNMRQAIVTINHDINNLSNKKLSSNYDLSEQYTTLKTYAKNFNSLKISNKNIVTISGDAKQIILFTDKLYKLSIDNILQIYLMNLTTTSAGLTLTAKLYGTNTNEK